MWTIIIYFLTEDEIQAYGNEIIFPGSYRFYKAKTIFKPRTPEPIFLISKLRFFLTTPSVVLSLVSVLCYIHIKSFTKKKAMGKEKET